MRARPPLTLEQIQKRVSEGRMTWYIEHVRYLLKMLLDLREENERLKDELAMAGKSNEPYTCPTTGFTIGENND